MSNIYQEKKKFDDALKAFYGDSVVNNPDKNGTNTVQDGLQIWTQLNDIDDSDVVDSQFLSVKVPYQIQFIRGNRLEDEIEIRKEQSADDYEKIISIIFEKMLDDDVRNAEYENGNLEFDTQNDYQSYGNIVFLIDHSFRVVGND